MSTYIVGTHLVVGFLFAAVGFLGSGTWGAKFPPRPIDRLLGLAGHRWRRRKLLDHIRWEVDRLLQVPVFIIAWPAMAIVIYRCRRWNARVPMLGQMSLMPVMAMVAAASCTFAVVLVALRWWNGPSLAIDLGCIGLLVALLARFLSGTVSAIDLPGGLRLNTMPPYVQFLVTAVLDYLSLLLVATLVQPSLSTWVEAPAP